MSLNVDELLASSQLSVTERVTSDWALISLFEPGLEPSGMVVFSTGKLTPLSSGQNPFLAEYLYLNRLARHLITCSWCTYAKLPVIFCHIRLSMLEVVREHQICAGILWG